MKIKICDITGKPFQSRKEFNEKEIAVLGADIATNGLLHPIIVRESDSGYDLISGERRLRAHIALDRKDIEAKVVNATDSQAKLIAAAENIQRENLKPLEEANAIAAAISESTIDDVATAFGRPVGYITRRAKLCELPDEWKKAVESGFAKEYPVAVLIEIARAPEAIQAEFYKRGRHGWGNINVETIHQEIFDKDRVISKAQFDIEDCRKCQLSTSAAPTLFDDIVTGKKDRCMNEKCWNEKKNAALVIRAEQFRAENPKGVVIADYSAPEELRKNAINEWDCASVKKSDKGAVAALDLKTGKTKWVKLNESAQKKASKIDEDGKQTMKERCAKLEKRRVVRYLDKIVKVIKEMVTKRHEFPYSTIVPLVPIFGAMPITINGGTSYLNPLDAKFNDDHAQVELFLCLAPQMIKSLTGEARSENPQKKRGDVFKEWLGIQTEKLYVEAVEEIPEPKSWAKEIETKPAKKETKTRKNDTKTHGKCRICGCTENTPCIDENSGDSCSWVESDLCSACTENEKAARGTKDKRYIFNGYEIFVSAGLGGKEFGTFRVSDGGSGLKRIVSKTMPMVSRKEEAQSNLDSFAAEKLLPCVAMSI